MKELSIPTAEFISTVFSPLNGDETIYQGGRFGHNPRALRSRTSALYTCTSTFHPDPSGRVVRQGAFLARYHLVVLDDVGSKIDPNLIEVEPTYVIESSQGNYQYGYALTEPLSPEDAGVLVARFKARKPAVGDAGGLKVNQLIRLPSGVNGKENPAGGMDLFKVRLDEWHPEMRYSADELVDLFQLPEVERGMITVEGTGERSSVSAEMVADHPIANYVEVRSVEPGKMHIECPNKHNHSGSGGEKETTLMLDWDGEIKFHCFHEHCADFDFDLWAIGRGYEPLEGAAALTGTLGALMPVPPTDDKGTPIPEAAEPVTNGKTDELLDNVTILHSGKYYLRDINDIVPGTTLNMIYGHKFKQKAEEIIRKHKRKQVAKSTGWYPTDDRLLHIMGHKYVNTYRAPTVTPKQGDTAMFTRLMNFVYGKYARVVEQHMAYTYLFPDKKIRWQILCYGLARTGKSMSCEPLKRILGASAQSVENSGLSTGWGDYFIEKKMIIFEEIWGGDRMAFNDFKVKCANDDFEMLNPKGRPIHGQYNRYSIYMFTNKLDALKFDRTEDKLLVIRGPEDYLPKEFYTQFRAMCEGDAFIQAMAHRFQHCDLSDFNPHRLPERTDALFDMLEEASPDFVVDFWRRVERDAGFVSAAGTIDIMDALRDLKQDGWRPNRRAIAESLSDAGYVYCLGQLRDGRRIRKTRFWAPGELVAGMSAIDLFYLHVPEGTGKAMPTQH